MIGGGCIPLQIEKQLLDSQFIYVCRCFVFKLRRLKRRFKE
jgi:hypothetical protein